MSVFDKILTEAPEGLILFTPVRYNPFKLLHKQPEQIIFMVKKTKIKVTKESLNGIPDFLKNKGWVKIGAKHDSLNKIKKGSLERYLRENSATNKRSSQGSYVAPLLEHLSIIQVIHKKPSAIKLKT
ncbi:MAG: hypothetical protein IAX21_01365 [Candidatus Bathyarchaeota archaeon]|nr:MAG: hypothetical protein IAX21_01365 [Candidatus Bathyarchaeota archaeon]